MFCLVDIKVKVMTYDYYTPKNPTWTWDTWDILRNMCICLYFCECVNEMEVNTNHLLKQTAEKITQFCAMHRHADTYEIWMFSQYFKVLKSFWNFWGKIFTCIWNLFMSKEFVSISRIIPISQDSSLSSVSNSAMLTSCCVRNKLNDMQTLFVLHWDCFSFRAKISSGILSGSVGRCLLDKTATIAKDTRLMS